MHEMSLKGEEGGLAKVGDFSRVQLGGPQAGGEAQVVSSCNNKRGSSLTRLSAAAFLEVCRAQVAPETAALFEALDPVILGELSMARASLAFDTASSDPAAAFLEVCRAQVSPETAACFEALDPVILGELSILRGSLSRK